MTFSEMWSFAIQTVGRSSLGKDETELPSVQGGNFHGASQPAGGSPPKCFARKLC